jgi:hypothetical protein
MINLKKEAWFKGLSLEEILAEVAMVCSESVEMFQMDCKAESRFLGRKAKNMVEEIMPSIVDEKSWFYGHNQDAYDKLESLQECLIGELNDLENMIIELIEIERELTL